MVSKNRFRKSIKEYDRRLADHDNSVNITKLEFGNRSFVQVCEWNGELRVDLREWDNDKPTKKGISLTLMR